MRQTSSVPLRALTRLWWLMVQRRWSQESSVGLAALAFGGFLVLLSRAPMPPGAAGITLAMTLAVGNATLMCLSVGGLSISAARRLRLLPLDPRVAFRARLILGSPLRLPLFAVSFGWALVRLALLGLSPLRFAIEAMQTGLLIAAAMLLSTLFEDPRGAFALRLLRAAFIAVSGVLTVIVAGGWWGVFQPSLSGLSASFAAPARALLVGGNEAWLWELAVLAIYALAAVLLFGAGERHERASALEDRGRPGASVFSRLAAPLPIRLRKEMFVLLRTVRLRREIAGTVVLAILAFAVGAPWLLLGLFLIWMGFLVNALGVDLPLDGARRYHLTGYGTTRALAWRHAAVVVLVAGCVAIAALTIWVAHGIPVPVTGMPSRWQYVGMSLFALSILMLTATVTGGIAREYPFPLARRAPLFSPQPTGPAMLLVRLLLAIVAVAGGAAAAFVAGNAVSRVVGHVVASADTPATALALAAVMLAFAFAALTRRALPDHD